MYAFRAASLGNQLVAPAPATRIRKRRRRDFIFQIVSDQNWDYMSSKLQVFVNQTKDRLKQEQDRLDLLLKKCEVNLVVSLRLEGSLTGSCI